MPVLSSFAISIAAGIALRKIEKGKSSVDKSIRSAFNDAMNDWSKNDFIRSKNRDKLKSQLKLYILNPVQIPEDHDVSTFLEFFNKRLCEHDSANNYLSQIKDEKRYQIEIYHLKKLDKKQDEVISIVNENKNGIEELTNIVKKISEVQTISVQSKQCTILSLSDAKKTVEALIISYKKSLLDKKNEVEKLEKNIDQFERDLFMIENNLRSLKGISDE
jgi:hypothetical protein